MLEQLLPQIPRTSHVRATTTSRSPRRAKFEELPPLVPQAAALLKLSQSTPMLQCLLSCPWDSNHQLQISKLQLLWSSLRALPSWWASWSVPKTASNMSRSLSCSYSEALSEHSQVDEPPELSLRLRVKKCRVLHPQDHFNWNEVNTLQMDWSVCHSANILPVDRSTAVPMVVHQTHYNFIISTLPLCLITGQQKAKNCAYSKFLTTLPIWAIHEIHKQII